MKVCILSLAAIALLAAADKPADKKAAQPVARTGAKAPAAVTLPTGAVVTAPGTYSYTDLQGKKWIYRETPFGLARFEDKSAAKDPAAEKQRKEEEQATTAVEDGDTIRFTRPGPFGPYKWQRKKTDLDATEKAIWDRAREKSAAGGKGGQE